MVERMRAEAHPSRGWKALNEAETSSHLKIREPQGSDSPAAPFEQ
jgi:hypothetical protein